MNESAISKDERTWGMLCHLIAFCGVIIPLGNLIGPLVIWLIKKEEMPFVDDQGKESLNFQISTFVYAIVCGILTMVVIGLFLLIALAIFWLVFVIIAAVNSNKGVMYRYPYIFRLIK